MILGTLLYLIPVAPLFGSYAFVVLLISFFFSGFSRSYGFAPFFILNQHFDGAK